MTEDYNLWLTTFPYIDNAFALLRELRNLNPVLCNQIKAHTRFPKGHQYSWQNFVATHRKIKTLKKIIVDQRPLDRNYDDEIKNFMLLVLLQHTQKAYRHYFNKLPPNAFDQFFHHFIEPHNGIKDSFVSIDLEDKENIAAQGQHEKKDLFDRVPARKTILPRWQSGHPHQAFIEALIGPITNAQRYYFFVCFKKNMMQSILEYLTNDDQDHGGSYQTPILGGLHREAKITPDSGSDDEGGDYLSLASRSHNGSGSYAPPDLDDREKKQGNNSGDDDDSGSTPHSQRSGASVLSVRSADEDDEDEDEDEGEESDKDDNDNADSSHLERKDGAHNSGGHQMRQMPVKGIWGSKSTIRKGIEAHFKKQQQRATNTPGNLP